MNPSIFVDGQEGTTGLRIHEHLAQRGDLNVLKIDAEKRKDTAERKRLINSADIVFLCLPDAASREAVALVENPNTRVIDASTAYRTDPTWAYGLPELSKSHRDKIRASKRIANPGCHATAFLLGAFPLVQAGVIPTSLPVTCFSLTGYSGGGKKMIASYESSDAPAKLKAPRHYGLKLNHKHLPEMQKLAGLDVAPMFTPVVCAVHSGLSVELFLPVSMLGKKVTAADVQKILADHYAGEKFVKVMPADNDAYLDEGFFDITACNGTNRADIYVFGNADQIAVITRLDNLGKGASGAAIQCMNILLGCDEATGLSA